MLETSAPSLNKQMPKEECRESRPVPFSPNGIVWAAAAGGVLDSTHVDEEGRFGSPVKPTQKRLLPFETQQRPFAAMESPSRLSANSAVWGSVQSVRSTVDLGSGSGPPDPPDPPGPPAPRPPLQPTSGNVDVTRQAMGVEIQSLEKKLAHANRQMKVQQQLIDGFCKLEAVRHDAGPGA